MIQTVTQYLIQCDTPGCGKKSGIHHDRDKIVRMGNEQGWQWKYYTPDSLIPVKLFRCPKCVKAGLFPDRWNEEAV